MFDDRQRTYSGWALENESTYSWLDRSTKPEAAAARARIEALYSGFGDSTGRLLRDLRHPDGRHANAAYHAALASLLMHDRLRKLGFEITTDEDIAGSDRRPDLIASSADIGKIVVEVSVLRSKQEFADHDWRSGILCQAINDGVRSDDYLLSVQVDGELPDDFDPAPVVRAIRAALADMPTPAIQESEAGRPHPTLDCRLGHVTVSVGFIPYTPKNPNDADDHRIIGIYPGGGGCPNTEGRLRNKLKGKRPSNYPAHVVSGVTPYVIAIGLADAFSSSSSCRDALWGDEAIMWSADNPDDARPTRKPNGFFGIGPNGPRQPDVSGVLLMHNFSAEIWKPGIMTFEYLENPHANCPIDPRLFEPDRIFGVVEKTDSHVRLDWYDG